MNIEYNRYKKIRDLAWQVLIESGVNTFPINVQVICKYYNIKLISYTQAVEMIEDFYESNQDACCIIHQGKHYIIYNQKVHKHRKRFSIAHELGHILLKHNYSGAKNLEEAANMFASRLLVPSFLLHFLNTDDIHKISSICNVSPEVVRIRLERFEVLKTRGMFFKHPLEREAYKKFREFIQ